MGKYKYFKINTIKARNSKEALKKARNDALGFGEVITAVRLVSGEKVTQKIKKYNVYGGKRER